MYTYGCNAIHRDFIPDYLISMDKAVVNEIVSKNIHKHCTFYTQHSNSIDKLAEEEDHRIFFFNGRGSTLDSGTSALELAAKNNDIVYIIGFDYVVNDRLPNVYHGTMHYSPSSVIPSAPQMTSRWRQRLRKIVNDYPNIKFIRVNGSSTDSTIVATNYSEITPKQFKEIYDPTT
jgi:hypothetical protein